MKAYVRTCSPKQWKTGELTRSLRLNIHTSPQVGQRRSRRAASCRASFTAPTTRPAPGHTAPICLMRNCGNALKEEGGRAMTRVSLDDTQFPELRGGQEARVARRGAEVVDSDAAFGDAAPV